MDRRLDLELESIAQPGANRGMARLDAFEVGVETRHARDLTPRGEHHQRERREQGQGGAQPGRSGARRDEHAEQHRACDQQHDGGEGAEHVTEHPRAAERGVVAVKQGGKQSLGHALSCRSGAARWEGYWLRVKCTMFSPISSAASRLLGGSW